jgi:hypothetical protein
LKKLAEHGHRRNTLLLVDIASLEQAANIGLAEITGKAYMSPETLS